MRRAVAAYERGTVGDECQAQATPPDSWCRCSYLGGNCRTPSRARAALGRALAPGRLRLQLASPRGFVRRREADCTRLLQLGVRGHLECPAALDHLVQRSLGERERSLDD